MNSAKRFREMLLAAQELSDPVAVYSDDSDLSEYEVGFIEEITSTDVILLSLTPKGEPDGRQMVPIDEIHRIDSGSAYVKKLRLLHEYRDLIFAKAHDKLPEGITSDKVGLLKHAKESGILVSLADRYGYGPSGFVRELTEDYVELQRITSKGMADGVAVVLLESVDRVHIGRREEQVASFLYRYHHGLERLLGE